MPNHITNLITFGTDSDSLSTFQKMLHDMRADGEPLGSFDFNKLIPMPGSLDIPCSSDTKAGLKLYTAFQKETARIVKTMFSATDEERKAAVTAHLAKWDAKKKESPEVWELGEKAFQNIQKYGCPTWYEWANKNWGTKWNAYQGRPLQDGDDTMCFLTAWSAVPGLMEKLSEKYPEQTITYRWADEDIGNNVGEMVLKGGEIIEDHTPVPGSREAYEMASDIMGIDLAAFGLYLNKDRTNYEYQDEPPAEAKPKPVKKPKRKEPSR